jgi:hypothetical protein
MYSFDNSVVLPLSVMVVVNNIAGSGDTVYSFDVNYFSVFRTLFPLGEQALMTRSEPSPAETIGISCLATL